jgi:hypothetical protein
MIGARPDRLSGWWILAAYALLVLPAILAGGGGSSQAADFREYHLLEIQRLAGGWPRPELRDSLTSTTPGFHLLMSIGWKLGLGVTGLRLLASLAGLAAWWVVWRVACRWLPERTAAWVSAPVALSPYLLGAAVWSTTEALAVALAAGLMGAAFVMRPAAGTAAASGVLGAGAVLVRQILLWASVPVVLRLLQARRGVSLPRRLVWAMVAIVPPVACVVAFAMIWGGPVPPRFQFFHQSMGNPAAPVVALAVFGVWGVLLLPGAWRSADPGQRRLSLLAASVGLLLACSVETAYRKVLPPPSQQADTAYARSGGTSTTDVVVGQHEVGRWGGPLWDAAKVLPEVGGRSVAVTGAAMLGAGVLALLWGGAQVRGRGREAAWLLAAMAGMGLSQSANAQTFQRYFDPWVLLGLAWLMAMGWRPMAAGHAWMRAGLLTLAGLQLGMTVIGVLKPAWTGPALIP